MADLVRFEKSRSKFWRRLSQYVGLRADLTTAAKDTIVDGINEVNTKLGDMATTAAGLAIGSASKKKVKIVNTVTFLIGGAFKSKTTAEIAFTATTHDIACDADTDQEAVYTVSLQADGTATLTMGAQVAVNGTAEIPAGPVGECVIGYVKISVDAGATPFDASSDDLDAAHLTVIYTDVAFLE